MAKLAFISLTYKYNNLFLLCFNLEHTGRRLFVEGAVGVFPRRGTYPAISQVLNH